MSIGASLMLIVYAIVIMSMFLNFRLRNLTPRKQAAAILFVVAILGGNILAKYLLGQSLYGKLYLLMAQLPVYIGFAIFSRYRGVKLFFVLLSTIIMSSPPIVCVTVLRVLYKLGTTASLVAYFLCYVLMALFIYKVLKSDFNYMLENCESRQFWLFCLIPLLSYVHSFSRTKYDFSQPFAHENFFIHYIPTIIVFASYILLVRVFRTTRENQLLESEKHIMQMQMESARLHLDELKNTQEQAITYRHDIRYHLSLIGSFAAENDLAKIKSYLSSTQADIDAITPAHYCENEIVNLILSSFDKQADKMGVALHTNVKLPQTLPLSDTELCALLSNALENAITAASQLADEKLREVHIRALINHNKLLISTENAYTGEIEMVGELPQSKNKKAGHGIGFKSMVSIVERHQGLYSIETAGEVFVLQLMLPL